MGDDITIGVTEIVNNIEVTAQPNDQVIDINVTDNSDEVTLNITPTVVEININKGSSYAVWGGISGNLIDQTDLANALILKADLVDGKVPAYQLPAYVDDVIEVANFAALPAMGEIGKIYLTLDNNKIYRWSGSIYIEIASNQAIWGAITGSLSNQTDLQNALNAKQNTITLTTNGTSGVSTLIGSTLNIPNYTTDISGLVPYTGATQDVNLGVHTLLAQDLEIIHSSGSGVAAFITKNGNGEALTVIKGSGSGRAASITGGVTLISELNLTTSLADAYIASAAIWNAKQNALNGTGFVKISGTTISYDNSTYVPTSRTITINGVTQDLSANRTFNISSISIGTANGLSLNGTVLSLSTANSLNSGALSAEDFFTFTNKIGGSGTTNYIPKFTGTRTLGNSLIFDNGTNVGIGTTSPAAKLDVNGHINVTSAAINFGGSGSALSTDPAIYRIGGVNDLAFAIGSTERMRITSGGNVLIGTTTDNGSKLNVAGSGNVATFGTFGSGNDNYIKFQGTANAFDVGVTNGKFGIADAGVAYIFTMTQLGAATFTNSVTATGFFNSSDIRLKEIVDYDYSVSDIKPITYIWKNSEDKKRKIGYSAQEVQKVMPDAVKENEEGFLSVDYVQILVAKIADLENRIKQLEK